MPAPIILLFGEAGSGKDTAGTILAREFNAVCVAQADVMKRFVFDVFGFSENDLWGPSPLRNTPYNNYNEDEAWAQASRQLTLLAPDWLESILPELSNSSAQRKSAMAALTTWFARILSEHIDSNTGKFHRTLTPRYVLQTLGTEFGRNFSPLIWNDYAKRVALTILEGGWKYERTAGLTPQSDAWNNFVVITDGRFPNEVLGIKAINGTAIKVWDPNAPKENEAINTAGVKNHRSESGQRQVPNNWFDGIIRNDKTRGVDRLNTVLIEIVTELYRPWYRGC